MEASQRLLGLIDKSDLEIHTSSFEFSLLNKGPQPQASDCNWARDLFYSSVACLATSLSTILKFFCLDSRKREGQKGGSGAGKSFW